MIQPGFPVGPIPMGEATGEILDGAVSGPMVGESGGFGTGVGRLTGGANFWFGVEYLMYFIKESPVPIPLVTSGITTNPISGAVGQTGTQTLIGNNAYNDNPYSGIRFRAGVDFAGTGFGIEGSGFMLNQQDTTLHYPTATVAPSILGVPFASVTQQSEAVALLRFPDTVSGTSDFRLRTNFSAWELNLGYSCHWALVDWAYVGYKQLNLTEGLFLNNTFRTLQPDVGTYLGGLLPEGSVGQITDSFRTRNDFYGGQFGAVKRLIYRHYALEARTAIGFGNTRQRIAIDGQSSLNGGPAVSGGLFAQPSNIGTEVRNQFSVVPEVGLTLYAQVFRNTVAFVGYNFLYWNNVVRPGYEIDRTINLQQTPFGPPYNSSAQPLQPSVLEKRSTEVILHGLNAGLAIQF
ncbi:MAG: BBP7 family outer membrane beta-barrel protein [Gemmataceae bacterium]